MTVNELIAKLQTLPGDAPVMFLYDGWITPDVVHTYVSNNATVILVDGGTVVYHDEDRPLNAPSEACEPYWKTPRPETDAGQMVVTGCTATASDSQTIRVKVTVGEVAVGDTLFVTKSGKVYTGKLIALRHDAGDCRTSYAGLHCTAAIAMTDYTPEIGDVLYATPQKL